MSKRLLKRRGLFTIVQEEKIPEVVVTEEVIHEVEEDVEEAVRIGPSSARSNDVPAETNERRRDSLFDETPDTPSLKSKTRDKAPCVPPLEIPLNATWEVQMG